MSGTKSQHEGIKSVIDSYNDSVYYLQTWGYLADNSGFGIDQKAKVFTVRLTLMKLGYTMKCERENTYGKEGDEGFEYRARCISVTCPDGTVIDADR